MSPIKTRLKTALFAAVALAIVVGVALVLSPRPLTQYRGKSVQGWSLEAYAGNAEAVAILKEMGPAAVPELIRQLKEYNSTLRVKLWNASPGLPPTLRRYVRKFGPPTARNAREAAAASLGIIGPAAAQAAPALAAALHDPDGTVRWKSWLALPQIGSAAIPSLARALKHPNPETRTLAASAFGQIAQNQASDRESFNRAIPVLMKMGDDSDQNARQAAINALAKIGPPALLALARVAEDDGHPLHAASNRILAEFDCGSEPVASSLAKLAQEGELQTRMQVVEALAQLRPAHPLTRHTLIAALDDPSPDVRIVAARGLGQLGPRARAAIPALTRLTQSREEVVKNAAVAALAKIDAEKGSSARL